MKKLSNRFVYCFKIYKNNNEILYLTSHSKILHINSTSFLPNSGLNIREMKFNNSAIDLIKIEGIFEENGITKKDKIEDCKIEILVFCLHTHEIKEFLIFLCVNSEVCGEHFVINLCPKHHKLENIITKRYSRRCRASLGDEKCGVNLSGYEMSTVCDKRFETCRDKFDNAVNFRGEPFC